MVMHRCLNCGKISYNRIAGDDNAHVLLALLGGQDYSNTPAHLELLTSKDIQLAREVLFGKL